MWQADFGNVDRTSVVAYVGLSGLPACQIITQHATILQKEGS